MAGTLEYTCGNPRFRLVLTRTYTSGWTGGARRGPAPVCVMRYVSNVRVLCKEQPMLATALPVLDEQKKLGQIDSFITR